MTTRYQIKIVDADLVDLVHEVTIEVLLSANAVAGREVRSPDSYNAVFAAIRRVLQKYVRGFHVCGCATHCEEESEPTIYSEGSPVGVEVKALGKTRRIRRYVLSIELPLTEFMKEMEVEIVRGLASHASVRDWHGLIGPKVRDIVETGLGKHIFYNPGCNRGEYICEVGSCTEFDPWESVRPDAKMA